MEAGDPEKAARRAAADVNTCPALDPTTRPPTPASHTRTTKVVAFGRSARHAKPLCPVTMGLKSSCSEGGAVVAWHAGELDRRRRQRRLKRQHACELEQELR